MCQYYKNKPLQIELTFFLSVEYEALPCFYTSVDICVRLYIVYIRIYIYKWNEQH